MKRAHYVQSRHNRSPWTIKAIIQSSTVKKVILIPTITSEVIDCISGVARCYMCVDVCGCVCSRSWSASNLQAKESVWVVMVHCVLWALNSNMCSRPGSPCLWSGRGVRPIRYTALLFIYLIFLFLFSFFTNFSLNLCHCPHCKPSSPCFYIKKDPCPASDSWAVHCVYLQSFISPCNKQTGSCKLKTVLWLD